MEYLNVKDIQELFLLFQKITGITIAFAIQRTLQEEDNYSCSFCKNCIKKSKKGKDLCNKTFNTYVKEITLNNQIIEYQCHAGLTDIITPIKINDEIVTFIVAGQFIETKRDLEKAKINAKKLGIDENTYIKEYKKVKYINKKQKKIIVEYIKRLAEHISKIATENYNRQEQNNKNILTDFIIEGIDNSYNLDDILSIVCTELKNLFNLSSAKVFRFNKQNSTYENLMSYKFDDNAPDLTKIYDNKMYLGNIMKFWCESIEKEAKNNQVVIYDMEAKNSIPEKIRKLYSDAGIYSCIGIKINSTEDTYTILALLDNKKGRFWSSNDLEYLKNVSKRLSVAIKQNMLFNDLRTNIFIEKNLIDSLPFPIWIKTADSKFLRTNKAFYDYFKINNDDNILQTDGSNLFTTKSLKKIKDAEQSVKNKNRYVVVENITEKNIDKIFDINIYPIYDKNQEFSGTFNYIKRKSNELFCYFK